MLDIKFIKENKELIQEAARKKHISFDLDALLILEAKRITLLVDVEEKRAVQNAAANEVPKAESNARAKLINDMKVLKEELGKKEEELKSVMESWRTLMLQVPNVPDVSVPEGDSDKQNKEMKKWGKIPESSFTPKSHVDLMLLHDMADFERGAKVAGFRGYFLKGDGVLLENAVWQLALKHFLQKGFIPMIVPSLLRRETLFGSGYLPQGEEDLYQTQDGDYLAGTGEVATMGYYMDETIPKEKLPIKFLAFSPCFRREAGAHGKDTRGIFRVHEFFKFEQVVLCEANHETSVQLHEELTRNAEEFIELLGLPYRVVVNCGGDLGLGQVKKYDIETWVPSEGKYRETHSSSYFHDFQTRRLNIRYRDEEGRLRFVHSLNNTAVATPRILDSIIENYQQADGTIRVPDALIPFVGNDRIGA